MAVCQLGIFVERMTPTVAIKCDCYGMPTLRNTGFIPLFNCGGSQNNASTLFLISVSTSCDLTGVIWHFSEF